LGEIKGEREENGYYLGKTPAARWVNKVMGAPRIEKKKLFFPSKRDGTHQGSEEE